MRILGKLTVLLFGRAFSWIFGVPFLVRLCSNQARCYWWGDCRDGSAMFVLAKRHTFGDFLSFIKNRGSGKGKI